MSEQLETKASSGTARWVYGAVGVGGLAVGFLVAFLVVAGYQANWGVNQWGPVATWVSGTLTAGALIVAAFQARLARQSAADADRRLATQLQANRRSEQLNATAELWGPVNEFLTAVDNFENMLPGYTIGLTDYEELRDSWGIITGHSSRFEAAFAKANMIVDVPNILNLFSKMEEQKRRLVQLLDHDYWETLHGEPYERTQSAVYVDSIKSYRGSIIGEVRFHLINPYIPEHKAVESAGDHSYE